MKSIVASWPAKPRTKDTQIIALLYAGLLVLMSAAQLFSLEKFIPLLGSHGVVDEVLGGVLAVVLVTSGVFAVPFLLRMKISRGFRWCSMVAGWIVPAVWLWLGLCLGSSGVTVANVGLLGASVALSSGWWVVAASIGLGILAAWSSWGLWPGRRA